MKTIITKKEKVLQEVDVKYHIFTCDICKKEYEFKQEAKRPYVVDVFGKVEQVCSTKCLKTAITFGSSEMEIKISHWNCKKLITYIKDGKNTFFDCV